MEDSKRRAKGSIQNASAHSVTYGERATAEQGWRCKGCGQWLKPQFESEEHYKWFPNCRKPNEAKHDG